MIENSSSKNKYKLKLIIIMIKDTSKDKNTKATKNKRLKKISSKDDGRHLIIISRKSILSKDKNLICTTTQNR